MRVLISSTEYPGQDYYRISEPARAVNESGLGVDVTVRRGLRTTMVPNATGGPMDVGWVDTQDADVVVLQLPATDAMLQIMRLLQSQGVAVVVEIDDLLHMAPTTSPGFTAQIHLGFARRVMACAREADLVTVTTAALLKEYAPHGRGMIVPNAIPRRVAELPPAYDRDPEVLTIGWSGSAPSRPYDLRVIGSGLQQALDRTPGRSRVAILGQAMGGREALSLREEPAEILWTATVDEYVTRLGELFDIGIAPVREDKFNSGKSWLKVLEYAARGIYPVYAPHPEYDRLRIGHRARSARDWARWLTAGIEDADHRRSVAVESRERVLAGHLTEHTAPLWVDAWSRAVENRYLRLRKGA